MGTENTVAVPDTATVENTVSLFQTIESDWEAGVSLIETEFQKAWAAIENFWTAQVKPILKATLQYIENNGAADLLIIAERVVADAVAQLESGIPNFGEFLLAAAGTVWDEAKSAGMQIAEGAAHLAANMALTKVQGDLAQAAAGSAS